jgi:hypothetical protein
LSPVVIEEGSPLLITNIDVSHFYVGDRQLKYHLFDMFPGIQGSFKLSTATRMSATFPIVSPAVDLPLEEPERIADGGFFDNQATYWLSTLLRQSVSSIVDNYEELIWIEINAFGKRATEVSPECRPETHRDASRGIADAASWLTAPFYVMLNVREKGMPLRGEVDYLGLEALLQAEARAKGKTAFRVGRFQFSNSSNASLSWVLRGRDLECMRKELATTNDAELVELSNFWNNGRASQR